MNAESAPPNRWNWLRRRRAPEAAPVLPELRPGDLWYSPRRYFVDAFFFREAAGLPPGARVLDIGGKKVRKRGQFDISKYPLRVEYANISPEAQPDYLCDAASIPVPDGTYDAAILAEVLEHVAHPEPVLKEAGRVLRPGGVLLMTVPFHCDIHADPHDYARYTDTWMDGRLKEAGFSQVAIERQGRLLSVSADMLKRFAAQGTWPESAIGRRLFERFLGWWTRKAVALEAAGWHRDDRIVNGYTTGFGVRAVKDATGS